jgi:hypothetical protein
VYLLLVVDQASVGYQATGRKAGKRALTSIAAFLMVEFRMIVSTMILDVKLRGVAGAALVAGGWSCNTNGWARLRSSSSRHGRRAASQRHI